VKSSEAGNSLSDLKLLQKDFWEGLKEYAHDHKAFVNLGRTPKPQHWYNISFGTGRCHIALTLNTQKGYVGCEIYIRNDKALFDKFHNNKTEIERELEAQLEWMELPDATASRILLTYSGNPKEKKRWDEYFKWCILMVEKFSKVFKNYI